MVGTHPLENQRVSFKNAPLLLIVALLGKSRDQPEQSRLECLIVPRAGSFPHKRLRHPHPCKNLLLITRDLLLADVLKKPLHLHLL